MGNSITACVRKRPPRQRPARRVALSPNIVAHALGRPAATALGELAIMALGSLEHLRALYGPLPAQCPPKISPDAFRLARQRLTALHEELWHWRPLFEHVFRTLERHFRGLVWEAVMEAHADGLMFDVLHATPDGRTRNA
jgi:hypothetical protein